MANELRPALTPEQWQVVRRAADLEGIAEMAQDDSAAAIALANHALPDSDLRKLKHADVDLLRGVALNLGPRVGVSGAQTEAERAMLFGLADRIEALLPPEE